MSATKRRRFNSGPAGGQFLKIGDVQVPIRTARQPELVPRGFGLLSIFGKFDYSLF